MALVVLAVFWIVVLVPPLLRARAEHVSRDSIRDFSFRIGALGTANTPRRSHGMQSLRMSASNTHTANLRPVSLPAEAYRPSMAASSRSELRRRQVVSVLGISAVVNLMLAVSGTQAAWLMFGVSTVLLLGFVGLIAHFRPTSSARVAIDRIASVRYLPSPQSEIREEQPAYRRTANY